MKNARFEDSVALAKAMRSTMLRMIHGARSSHVGSCLSMADILAVLYADIMRFDAADPQAVDRDIYLQGKGHAAAILYACLMHMGFIPPSHVDDFGRDGAELGGHITRAHAPGVEMSSGSLGHALNIGAGMALYRQRLGRPGRVFTVLSDGECDEGSVWEAALFAAHHGLNRLTAIVDYNKIQSFGRVEEVLRLEPFVDKWRAFGWEVSEVDGHDHDALRARLGAGADGAAPRAVIAHTTKGKGVSFMEDQLLYHYRPPSDEQLAQALAEVDAI